MSTSDPRKIWALQSAMTLMQENAGRGDQVRGTKNEEKELDATELRGYGGTMQRRNDERKLNPCTRGVYPP